MAYNEARASIRRAAAMPEISATIITLSEEKNIARAIRSLADADEIIVVDSGSTDATCAIAAEMGARVIHNPWPGYAAQKNFAARQARHDWVFSLDADEELDAQAREALRQWKQTSPNAAGYRWPRCAWYMGRWIWHSGWYPDWKLRLYDRRRGEWRGDYVHESVVLQEPGDGPIPILAGEILHYSAETPAEQNDRIERYTDLAAREMLSQGRRATALDLAFAPPFTFLQTYFLKLGFLDGRAGYCIARSAAHYVRRKYEKLAAKSRQTATRG
jgi:glycosyltransferase involved in cell wall biosynthesis